jgi:dipeptidyl-peptidase-4
VTGVRARIAACVRFVRARIAACVRYVSVRRRRGVEIARATTDGRSIPFDNRLSVLVMGVHRRDSFVRSSGDCTSGRASARDTRAIAAGTARALALPPMIGRRSLAPLCLAAAIGISACERGDTPPPGAGPQAPVESLTVRGIFAPPGPDGEVLREITWRPDGSAVAFLAPASRDSLTGDEVLALWLADPATGERRRLLGIEDLLGGERQTFGEAEEALRERLRLSARGITSYQWSPDGSRILVPVSGDLYEHDTAAGTTRRLTDTPEPEFDPRYSPDGTRIAFVRDGDLWLLDVQTRAARRLTTGASDTVSYGVAEFIAQEELGRRRGHWWSPDGRRIAFAEVDEADVPVFALTDYRDAHGGLSRQRYPRPGDPNATVRLWAARVDSLAPSDSAAPAVRIDVPSGPDWYLARVAWRPDGKRLVVQVLPRSQNELRVLDVDAATGAARTLFVERDDQWVGTGDDPIWLPDGGFLWTSERSGREHVYRYDAGGRLQYPVTAGDWSVASIAHVDAEGGWLYITGHVSGPFERHLYRARLDGSAAREGSTAGGTEARAGSPPLQRVSREPGWHQATFAPGSDRYVDTWSTATRAPSVSTRDADTGERLAWIEENGPGRLAEYGLVRPEFLWVRPIDDDGDMREDSLPAMLYRPRDFDPERRYPVLVYTYGGPGSQTVVDDWLSRGRGLWHQLMVQRGFLVWSCDGRGTGARGKAWVELVHERLGILESEDQAACVRALWRNEPAADSTRTGIWGWSYGGFMAARALVQEPEAWAAAAAVAPVSDWRDYDTAYTERYMELPSENEEGYEETSVLPAIEAMTDPFFLAWGTTDDNVHSVHSERLVDALIAVGHPPEVHVFPGRGHAIGDSPARIALFGALTDFFTRHLGAPAAPASASDRE